MVVVKLSAIQGNTSLTSSSIIKGLFGSKGILLASFEP